ncbi:MAG TPA: hypothetical protein VG294_10725 [Solirubrobacteraceae bacterium]|jgi:hypothetical protein|nr:hypothetical protein [Solirubrobacteraceae bacterium]
MADWVTISSLATAGGTLVLAVATFSSVRSANRAARTAERSLLVGLRPVLIPSREDDPVDRVLFGDDHRIDVPGHGGVVEVVKNHVYMAIGLRNAGSGLAVIHGWYAQPYDPSAPAPPPDPDDFHRQQLDLYIPAGADGYWQGAIRDQADEQFEPMCAAVESARRIIVDLLYGDHEGGQRAIARFSLVANDDGKAHYSNVLRYWNLDNDDPRQREA